MGDKIFDLQESIIRRSIGGSHKGSTSAASQRTRNIEGPGNIETRCTSDYTGIVSHYKDLNHQDQEGVKYTNDI